MSKKGRREACDQGQVGRWCCGGSVLQKEGHDHEGGQNGWCKEDHWSRGPEIETQRAKPKCKINLS